MSEPMETDALRAWAVDAQDIAASGGSGPNMLQLCASNLITAADEMDRLRAVIENAPHKCDCSWPWDSDEPNPDGWECTCWKADAL